MIRRGLRLLLAIGSTSWLAAGYSERAEAQAALLGAGAVYIGAGLSGIRTADLDSRLAANGYPTFGQKAIAINIGAYRLLRNGLMLGFEGNGLIIGEEPHAGGEVGLGGGYATLGVAYALRVSRRARIYPRLGIGAGGMGLWFDEHPQPVPFDDVLRDPSPRPDTHETVLGRDGFVADLGAGIELLRHPRSGPLVGLRFGYLVAPFNSKWDLVGEGEATGGPDASISGPYVRVTFGGAWKR